ncbi:MAG: hypothetical protein DRH12_13855 [Deltaproteobacteria bacterium]|nr:MAG: hypothetical protein DRH12_13855 [Deltaproteobacteria bacterium]
METGIFSSPDQRWIRILDKYLGEFGIALPEFPSVLDVACGNNATWNYLALVGYLGSKNLGVPRYVAIDVSEEAFAKAKEALQGLAHFISCDARDMRRYVEGPFHLVLCQHPPLTISKKGPKIWEEIFEEVSLILDPQGCMVLTSFWLNDHIPAQICVKKAGLEILYSGKNAFGGKIFDRSEDGEELRYDKYVLVARKARS